MSVSPSADQPSPGSSPGNFPENSRENPSGISAQSTPINHPGRIPAGQRWKHALGWLAFAGLCVFPLFFSLGDHPIHGDSEARYGVVARGMAHGEAPLLVPTLFGEPHLTKPPLTYWLMAASIRLIGDGELALRLPAAFSGVFTLAIVFGLAWRLHGLRQAAIAAAILSVTPMFIAISRLGITDGLLGLFSTAALASGLLAVRERRSIWCIALWASLALALLTKGPPGLLAPISLLAWLTLTRQWSALRFLRPILGFSAALLPLVAWGLFIAANNPEVWAIWKFQMFDRAVGTGDHPEPWWFFVPVFLLGFLPAVILLWHHKTNNARASWQKAYESRDESLLWLTTIVLVFTIFTLITGKLMSYLMPLAGPVAWWTSGLISSVNNYKKNSYKKFALISLCTLALFLAIAWTTNSLWGIQHTIRLWPAGLTLATIIGLAAKQQLRFDRRMLVGPMVVWLSLIHLIAWVCLTEDEFNGTNSVSIAVRTIQDITGLEEPQILTVGFGDRSLIYYTNQPTGRIDPRIMPDRWATLRKDNLILLSEPDEWDNFASDPHWDLYQRFELIADNIPLGHSGQPMRAYRVLPSLRNK